MVAVCLLVGLAIVQWVVGSRIPLDPDESYYWEWSRRLALGYYDHPPAIAYLIRAGTVIFGPTALGVRFVPILANLGGGLMMLLIARRLGGARAARNSALLVLSLPILAAWLLLATPDCPLFLTSGLALYAAVRIRSGATRYALSLKRRVTFGAGESAKSVFQLAKVQS